jgi:hypothetical protein
MSLEFKKSERNTISTAVFLSKLTSYIISNKNTLYPVIHHDCNQMRRKKYKHIECEMKYNRIRFNEKIKSTYYLKYLNDLINDFISEII